MVMMHDLTELMACELWKAHYPMNTEIIGETTVSKLMWCWSKNKKKQKRRRTQSWSPQAPARENENKRTKEGGEKRRRENNHKNVIS